MVVDIAGLGFSTFGAIQQGQAAQAAHNYNAQVSASNAAYAKQQAILAEQQGEAQAAYQGQVNRAQMGEIKSGQSASGIRMDSGSAEAVRESAKQLGELDISMVRSNAAREAYGHRVQAANEMAEGIMEKYAAKTSKKAGDLKAVSTFLGGAGQLVGNYAGFKKSGAL